MSESQRHILYVEDNLSILEVTSTALRAVGGFHVTAFSNGEDAIEAAQKGLAPDLLLLDVMMPHMDGPTTLEALRAFPQMQNIPAVFFTAKAPSSDVRLRYGDLVADIISKPFDPVILPERIHELFCTAT